MTFTVLDGIIVVAYLGGIALFGIVMGGRQRSARDYFVSERAMPWWAVCLTIVATETSAITFLSLPGIAYSGSMVFLQLALGYIAGRVLVAIFLIPRYFDDGIATAYSLLERKFSPTVRRAASGVFMLTRLFADGVRLYTTAIPLALIVDGFGVFPDASPTLIYLASMTLLTLLTLVYVFYGGIRAVIWTDVVQWGIYILGAVVSLVVIFQLLPQTPAEALSQLAVNGTLDVFRWVPDGGWSAILRDPYSTIAAVLGGMVLSMASHGTDQLIVQRVLASGSTAAARKAMVMSGIVVFVQFAAFLLVGALLSLHYPDDAYSANEVFSVFILHELPEGMTGLVIAGIFAAAMSTLSSSISALSSASTMDLLIPLRKSPIDDATALRLSRNISLLWALVLLAVAAVFIETPSTVVELALSIASYTYGGLLALFILHLLPLRLRASAAAISFFTGIVANGIFILFTPLAWTWYTLSGTILTMVFSLLVNMRRRTATHDAGALP
ncbi:MAG: sodium:solute symporter [Bacteroidota bacterium]|jgi:SSS family transporter|nr:sodium:solute symporter [Bacteroidota bacterium]